MGYKSERGLRRHIDTTHNWYYYFDEQPALNREEAIRSCKDKVKCSTHKLPAFSLDQGIGQQFLMWLATPCGGGKCKKEGIQIGRRAMKFLKASMGEQDEETVSEEYVDCCLGSPSIIMSFLKVMTEVWEISSSGALNYMKAIGDLMDFRKSSGVSDEVLRSFVLTEVYIRRGKENLSKQKRLQYARNLDLERLIARNSWATIEDMEKVIPYHTPTYQCILRDCQKKDAVPTISQLAFATRFVATFLFLRVKCTRPMSYQFLTVKMVEDAKLNGGFVDQTSFKTQEAYAFDTLVLTEPVLKILDTYKTYIRPLCHPLCEFFLVTTNGTQYTAFSTAMSLLVYGAIGKYVHPTRYRQIVETESNERLSDKDRATISTDQKHSSYVAKRVYQKKLSREVAVDGRACMEKISGKERDVHTRTLALSLHDDGSGSIENKGRNGKNTSCVTPGSKYNEESSCNSTVDIELVNNMETAVGQDREVIVDYETAVVNITEIQNYNKEVETAIDTLGDGSKAFFSSPISPLNIDVDVKKEEAEDIVQNGGCIKRFTSTEDKYLKLGVQKYGYSNWSKILRDKEYKFSISRTRDSLRMRSKTLGLLKSNLKKKSH